MHVRTARKGAGRKSAKFLCSTGEGRTLRLKYWDRERDRGNREVFAMVAATRLMWALGFEVLHVLPMNVSCRECPGNPMTGEGARAMREYLAEISVYLARRTEDPVARRSRSGMVLARAGPGDQGTATGPGADATAHALRCAHAARRLRAAWRSKARTADALL